MSGQEVLFLVAFGLLAVQCSGNKGLLNQALADVSLLGAEKTGFHSHLQRMLQTEGIERAQTEAKTVCSPAARQDGACISSYSEIPLPEHLAMASSASIAAPARKTVSYGPMTQDAYDRLVQRKRAAVKSKLVETELGSSGTSEIPLPEPHPASKTKPGSDFEMRFEPQTPSPDPSTRVLSVAESPAPASLTTSVGETLEVIAESPAPAPTVVLAATTTTTSAASSSGNGPARPPMTEEEAARAAAQQAVQQAAREASLARKREYVQEQVQRKKPAAASYTSTSASAAASKKPQQVSMPKQVSKDVTKSIWSSSASKRRNTQKVANAVVVPKAVALAAAMRWDVLDYLCVLTLVAVVAVAAFIAIAVVEDVMSKRRIGRPKGTALVFHWLALGRGLFRRCRRSFEFARKHLTGHPSELPVSANETSAVATLLHALAPLTTSARVFWTTLHSSQCNRSRASSSGGSGCGVADTPFASVSAQMGYDGSSTATAELQLRRRH